MPNWVTIHFEVTGPEDDVRAFSDFMESADNVFDFNKLIPMPQELLDTPDDSFGQIGYAAWFGNPSEILRYPWVVKAGVKTREELQEYLRGLDQKRAAERANNPPKPPPLGINWSMSYEEQARKYNSNIEKYGFKCWYDWAIDNWGTKWTPSDTNRRGTTTLQYRFNTAWSFPEPIFETIAEKFPTLVIRGRADEEAGFFRGPFNVKKGRLITRFEKAPEGFEDLD